MQYICMYVIYMWIYKNIIIYMYTCVTTYMYRILRIQNTSAGCSTTPSPQAPVQAGGPMSCGTLCGQTRTTQRKPLRSCLIPCWEPISNCQSRAQTPPPQHSESHHQCYLKYRWNFMAAKHIFFESTIWPGAYWKPLFFRIHNCCFVVNDCWFWTKH